MPFALIFNWISILALSSIYCTSIHCSALILMDLNSIIWDIVIEYRGTTYDNFYPDVSFYTLRSWASESTGLMCCESTASVFSKLDFTHYPSCMTFTCHACCSAPTLTLAAAAAYNKISHPKKNNAEWLNWNWTTSSGILFSLLQYHFVELIVGYLFVLRSEHWLQQLMPTWQECCILPHVERLNYLTLRTKLNIFSGWGWQ